MKNITSNHSRLKNALALTLLISGAFTFAALACQVKADGDCVTVGADCTVLSHEGTIVGTPTQIKKCYDGSPGREECDATGGEVDCEYECYVEGVGTFTQSTTKNVAELSGPECGSN